MPQAVVVSRQRRLADLRRKLKFSGAEPYLYIAPAFALLVIFKYWPMVFSGVLSMLNWDFVSPDWEFVGLANYSGLLNREMFILSLRNTAIYTLALVPFYLIFPLVLAVILFTVSPDRLQSAYKAVIFSPTVLSFAITCMVWLWIFNPIDGILNQVLRTAGLPPLSWLSDSKVAIWAIALVTGWKAFGYNLVLYFAGLASIPKDYVEAAQIDGASPWKLFWAIKWPLLSPTTFFALVTTVIYAAERAFIPINILTKGGPYNSTTNLAYVIYVFGFNWFNVGLASAAAIVTFAIFVVLTAVQVRYLERYVKYET